MDLHRIVRPAFMMALAIAALTTVSILPAAAQAILPAGFQAPPEAAPMKPAVPLKIDVVLSRWQGEKKVSSLPFALYIVAPAFPVGLPRQPSGGGQTPPPFATQSVRMGVVVPIGTSSRVNTSGQATGSSTTTNTPEYRNVGTSIDGRVSQNDDGRFWVYVSVSDTSIFTNDGSASTQIHLADPMAFRTFTMNNMLSMRDGQTLPFAMASDKISGDILKVDVTVTVLK